MKKAIITVLVLALLGGAGYGLYEYKLKDMLGQGERVSSTSEDAVYVDSVSILAGLGNDSAQISRYAGIVEPQKTLEIKLESERTVAECFVSVGDEVKAGQKLFVYDVTEAEDKLEQAQIELEKCDIDIESAEARKAQYEKELAKASADDKLTLQTQILTEETSVKTSQYEKKTKEAEIKQLQETIANAEVFCEMDGVIKSISEGEEDGSENTSSGGTVYMTILALGDYRIKGTVNEQNINSIWEGMEMLIHSRLDEGVLWHGTITEINRDSGSSNSGNSDYTASYDNGTSSTNYPFYVDLESSEGLLLGQHVYLEQNVGQENAREGIWLDDYYFNDDGSGGFWVWAVSSANVLEKREVTLGKFDEETGMYEVLSGLDAEDYICQDGSGTKAGVPVIFNDYTAMDDPGMQEGGDYGYGAEDEDFGFDEELGDDAEEIYFDEGSLDEGWYEEDEEFAEYEEETGDFEVDYYDADQGAWYDAENGEYYTDDEEGAGDADYVFEEDIMEEQG